MFASLVGLVTVLVMFTVLAPSGGLFVLSAETSRLEFRVRSKSRADIILDGVVVQSRGTPVVGEFGEPGEVFCYSGVFTPPLDSLVELTVEQGAPRLRVTALNEGLLSRAIVRARPNEPTVLGRRTARSINGVADTAGLGDPATGQADPQKARLSFNGERITLQNNNSSFDLDEFSPAQSAAMSLQLIDPESQPGNLQVGDLTLDLPVDVFSDARCANEDGSTPSKFATRTNPINLNGPAIIGRKLRPIEGNDVVLEEIPFIRSSVEIIIRQVLCKERFAILGDAASFQADRECKRIYRVDNDRIDLPPGSAITGRVDNDIASDFYGQVTFEDGRYQVQASTEAEAFQVLRPGAGGRISDANQVSVPLLGRLLLEPWLIVMASIFFTLSGLVLGILQIEDQDNLLGPADQDQAKS
ncbi:MAG: hypothetical protein AAF566_05350 [Pseudomonadota bacterium]